MTYTRHFMLHIRLVDVETTLITCHLTFKSHLLNTINFFDTTFHADDTAMRPLRFRPTLDAVLTDHGLLHWRSFWSFAHVPSWHRTSLREIRVRLGTYEMTAGGHARKLSSHILSLCHCWVRYLACACFCRELEIDAVRCKTNDSSAH